MSDDLTLEKMKIKEAINEVNTTLQLLRQTQENMNSIVLMHGKELYGNGTPGLKTTVDRIDQWRITINRVLSVLIVAFVGLSGRIIYDILLKLSQ